LIVLTALEQPLQHREARLGPSERIPRVVCAFRPGGELPSCNITAERQCLELAP
jgi:hypothetical protein